MAATSAPRTSGVLPWAISVSIAGTWAAATSALETPMSDRRTNSPWFIGMPPNTWARYSPKAMETMSRSISPNLPSAVRRSE